MQTTETTINLRFWTVKEYHRMAEVGIFDEDERVELLEGNIICKPKIGTAHRSAVGRTDYLLKNILINRAWVSIQDPIQLDDYSEPEPEIAVVKIDPLDYADHHPKTDEVYLVIEVADTTFKKIAKLKGKLMQHQVLLTIGF